MFFVSPRSTAVLPPMEESIIERVVVGAVDEVDAAHIDGSSKTRQIAYDAAAHGNDEVAAAHVELQHLAQDAFEDLHALAGLALRDP